MWKNKKVLYGLLVVAIIAILTGATLAIDSINTSSSPSESEGLSEPFVPTWYPPQETPEYNPVPAATPSWSYNPPVSRPRPYSCNCHQVPYTCYEEQCNLKLVEKTCWEWRTILEWSDLEGFID